MHIFLFVAKEQGKKNMDTLIWTDSHAHLTTSPLLERVKEVIDHANKQQVQRIINICCDSHALLEGLKLLSKYPGIFLAAATSPHDAMKDDPFFSLVEKTAMEGHLIAIGETGLDYHYLPEKKEIQKEIFLRYVSLAKKFNLPLIIHCREAFDNLFSLLDSHNLKGQIILHCFTGSKHEAQSAIERGYYVSFSGIVTFKKSEPLREALKIVPLEKLFIETDSPYLAPEGKRGKVNEPENIPIIAKCIADVLGISLESLSVQLEKNLQTIFKEVITLKKTDLKK